MDSRLLLLLALALALASPALAAGPQIDGCPIFPEDNIWNTPVDHLPVDPNSAAYIQSIGPDKTMHPEFGSGLWDGGPIGIPFVVVGNDQPAVDVTFDYDDESDHVGYPVPFNAPIEGGTHSDGDRHVLVLNRETCMLYELYDAHPQSPTSWHAGSGAVFDLTSHALRPDGWTSADAAGLPILPGLVRYDEVAAGEINHAIRVTAPQTRRAYVWPARHFASSQTDPNLPPMGQRFRLKASVDISGFSPEVQVILRALKRYGMILADNGSSWFVTGAPDERWNNDVMHELHQLRGSDFEAVDVTSLQLHPDSGQARSGPAVRPVYADFDGDQKSEIVVWRPSLGLWFILTSASGYSFAEHQMHQLGLPGDIPLVGELDGDAKADLVVWRPADGTWFLRRSTENYQLLHAIQWGLPNDSPMLADFDGDGRSDLGIYRRRAGAFFVLRSSGNYNRDGALLGHGQDLIAVSLGGIGNDPLAGDFNGDGRDEFVAIWQLIRFWSVVDYAAGFLWSLPWGNAGDTPHACDWDGNGVSDRVIVRPEADSSLSWYVATDRGPVETLALGHYGDTSSCAHDFDGDGRRDASVFRDGRWQYRLSSDGGVSSVDFGLPGDLPL